jgi:hypothetical protein
MLAWPDTVIPPRIDIYNGSSLFLGELAMPEEAENGEVVSWWTVVRACSVQTRHTARMWLFYTLFYWLIPTVIVLIGLVIARQPIKPVDLIIHGEFLIYAITLTAGSTRLITKDVPKTGPFVNRQAFNLLAQIMIFPAIFVYGLLRYMGWSPSQNGLNTPVVVGYSVVLLIGAFCFSYIVFLIDVQRTAQVQGDVQLRAAQAIAHSPDALNRQFDALEALGTMTGTADNSVIETAADALTSPADGLGKDFDQLEDGEK